jgi:hypothetical protein
MEDEIVQFSEVVFAKEENNIHAHLGDNFAMINFCRYLICEKRYLSGSDIHSYQFKTTLSWGGIHEQFLEST